MLSPGAFFQLCQIFIFWAVRGVKGQNMAKDDKKKSVCCSWYVRNHISYDCHLWCTCVNDNTSWSFFHFFKISIFWIAIGIKGQKIAQNDKKSCLSCLYSRNHTSWLSFVVHKCNDNIFRHSFIFSKFWSFGLLGGSMEWRELEVELDGA